MGVRRALTCVGRLLVMLVLAGGWATVVSVAQGEDPGTRVRGYVPPPTALRLVDDHWTPYQPPMPPEGSQVHVIVKGDTLWDLAAHYYDDPYLWPVIWDANRYVTYSHWIYPGDPLVVPPHPTVVGEEGVQTVAEAEPEPEFIPRRVREVEPEPEAEPVAPPLPQGPVLIPAVEQQEMICSAQLVEHFDPTPLSILGAEEPEKELLAQADIVYLSAGRDMAIEPGAEYIVVRSWGRLQRSVAKRRQDGPIYLQRLGRVRVLASHAATATAEILDACAAIKAGDFLVPYREMPVPMVERIPLQELTTPFPGRLNGEVIVAAHPEATVARLRRSRGHRPGIPGGLDRG
ncbi:MAG: LysM peptidoglycan-binding domain-containing protein [Acidobacteriota bacterium]|nr:LysM peptidoglycan-binding domain-containing protein [Acidobacteriota bacterium]